jgi:hypothetical protein
VREGERWVAHRVGAGTRAPTDDLLVPADTPEEELAHYLGDVLHELAEPGRKIRRLDQRGVGGG